MRPWRTEQLRDTGEGVSLNTRYAQDLLRHPKAEMASSIEPKVPITGSRPVLLEGGDEPLSAKLTR
jgi:hypothetical protein